MKELFKNFPTVAEKASGGGLFKLISPELNRQNNFKLPLVVEVTK